MTQTQIELVDRIINAIATTGLARRIILFGSYAKGRPGPHSDVDVCVLVNMPNRRPIDIMRELRRVCRAVISAPLDILVYQEQDFIERARLQSTFEHVIIKEGQERYAA